MEVTFSSETSADFQRTARRYGPIFQLIVKCNNMQLAITLSLGVGVGIGVLLAADSQSTSSSGYRASLWDP
jgi:hypothetical protein